MVSYNAFVESELNGWQEGNNPENKLFLAVNPSGEGYGQVRGRPGTHEEIVQMIYGITDGLWKNLKPHLGDLDTIIVYVGTSGSEAMISSAARYGVRADQVIFVMCSCNIEDKMSRINASGFAESKIIECECGGEATMRRIYLNFLQFGRRPDE